MQHLIEVLTDGPAKGNIAHRRKTVGGRGNQYREFATSKIPACMTDRTVDDFRGWREYSAAHAQTLGAVGCTDEACFGGGA